MGCAMRVSPLPITIKTRLPNSFNSLSASHSKILPLSSSSTSTSTSTYTPTVKPISTYADDIHGQGSGFDLSAPGKLGSVIPNVRNMRANNAEIFVHQDESDESIAKRFRKQMLKSGAFEEMWRRRFHETKQDIKKRKIRQKKKRIRDRRMLSVVKDDETVEEGEDDNEEEEEDNWNIPDAEIGL